MAFLPSISVTRICLNYLYMFTVMCQCKFFLKSTIANVQLISPAFPLKRPAANQRQNNRWEVLNFNIYQNVSASLGLTGYLDVLLLLRSRATPSE